MPKIYFDVCCLNRPFDDQSQARIRLEAEDVFLTTDDQLLRQAVDHANELRVRVDNPLAWLQEVG